MDYDSFILIWNLETDEVILKLCSRIKYCRKRPIEHFENINCHNIITEFVDY